MVFHNIFSAKPFPSSPKPFLSTLTIDIHEKNSLVPSELSRLSIPFSFEHLEVGDYLINNVCIERKTLADLQSSIISKRIFQQIKNLQQAPQAMLLIEGFPAQDALSSLHENALRGFLLSITLKERLPLLFAENERDTAHYLRLLARKSLPKEIALAPKRLSDSPQEQARFILESFPGIGPAKAKALLRHFKTLKSIFNAPESELAEILGKRAPTFRQLLDSS